MRTGVVRALVASLVALSAAAAQAAIVFDNGGPNNANGNEVTQWVQAQDFSIAGGASVTGAGVYIAGFGGIGAWDGTMDYYFFADAGGKPGALLASGAGQNKSTMDSGTAWCCGGNAYLVTFDLVSPFAASAGTTYWFGFHASTNFNRDEIYWVTTASTNFNGHESDGGTFNNWSSNFQEHAFFLVSRDQRIPEPMSLALVGIGLAGLAFARRR